MPQQFLKFSTDYRVDARPLDIVTLETAMLWPDKNSKERKQSVLMELMKENKKLIAHLCEDPERFGQHIIVGQSTQIVLHELVMRGKDLKRARPIAFLHGRIAGEIVHRAVQIADQDGEPKALTKIMQDVVTELKSGGDKIKIELQTVRNLWIKNKPAAHLWATRSWFINSGRSGLDRTRPFPLSSWEFGSFLDKSEEFLEKAEKLKAKGASGPLLRKGEAIRPPAKLVQPKTKI